VAGLAAAGYLARQGFAVKLFEASPKPGGCCADTEVGGYVFNDGAQYLILSELLDYVFGRLGVERSRELPLLRVNSPQCVALDGGPMITFGPDLEITSSDERIDVSRARAEVDVMIHKWMPVLRILGDERVLRGTFSYRRLLSRLWRYLPRFGRSLQAELLALFSSPEVRSSIAGLLLFAGAHPRDLPAPGIVALVSILTDGMTLPEGGMGRIPAALGKAARAHGADIQLNSKVRRIITRSSRVDAVDVIGLGEVECRFVISTASAFTTYGALLSPDEQPGRLREKVKRSPLSTQAFSVQLGLSNVIDTPFHLTYAVPSMDRLADYLAWSGSGVRWAYYSVPTVVMPELARQGGSIVELFPAIPSAEPAETWDDERTRELAESAIDWLSRRHELSIVARRVRSPLDFQNQLHLHQGAVYGVSPTAGALGLFAHRGPVPGLFLAGQTTFPGLGVAASAMSGIYAAEALLAAGPS
jgi:phytoene dehydrogenase-like protein